MHGADSKVSAVTARLASLGGADEGVRPYTGETHMGGRHCLGRPMGESQTRSEAAGPSDTVPAGVERVRV